MAREWRFPTALFCAISVHRIRTAHPGSRLAECSLGSLFLVGRPSTRWHSLEVSLAGDMDPGEAYRHHRVTTTRWNGS